MEYKENDKPIAQVPYIVYESAQARLSRIIVRLWIIIAIIFIAFIVTNFAWIVHYYHAIDDQKEKEQNYEYRGYKTVFNIDSTQEENRDIIY